MDPAVVLLSGGLDSSTTLAIALKEGFMAYALTFAYGQRHYREVQAAKDVARALRVQDHRVLQLDLGQIGGSALTDTRVPVPMERDLAAIAEGIPETYVPARNTILLSHALAWSEVVDAGTIFVGATAIDYSGYPDCRPEFYKAFESVARVGTRRGVEGRPVKIRHPLIDLSKADIVRTAMDLAVPLDLTWSCYLGEEDACGLCDACQLRLKGFQEAGVADPIRYQTFPDWYGRGAAGVREG
ncbi:MAG: 7-cyano-7-deazaguanine synthase QueC [Thermoplasmata archaeon]